MKLDLQDVCSLLLTLKLLITMSQSQTRKGWHVLDQKKSKYFLVDVLSQSADGEKTKVRFHDQTYQILTSELLPYQAEKPDKLQDLQYPNKGELIEWLALNGAQQKWIKINPRVVIDFNINTQKHRMEHIKYLLGRFLISFRKKQYLVVANQPIKECNQHTIHQTLVKTLPEIVYLWPYAISLTTLNFIYRILFTQLPIKFKIFIKESEIIRMSIIPYNCQSKDLMGQMSESSYEILALKSPIFGLISSSPREMRKYYKVPQRVTGTKGEHNINNLVDSLIQIGCKVSEINSLIGLFVVILSINQLELIKGKKQNKTYFRLKQDSQTKDSLIYWLGKQLVNLLQQDLNKQKDSDNELKDMKIKQYVLIKLIWQEAIRSASNLINSKMFNFNAPYTQEVREFIFIEFPALGSSFQQEIHNEKLMQINQHIEKVALRTKSSIKEEILNDQKIVSKLKDQYGYDINKDILKELQKRRQYQGELGEGQFMTEFKRQKLNVSQHEQQQNAKKYNLNDLFQQINSLYDNDERVFANFIIRSEMNNNLPRKELLDNIQESIEEKRRIQQEKENDIENGNANPNDNDDDYDWIELLLTRFEQRYKYTQIAKSFYHKKISTFEGLQNYFKKKKHEGKLKIIDQKQIVFLSFQKYRQLQDERSLHDISSDKIKKQLKRYMYRKQFMRCVNRTCLQIKFIKQLIAKITPSIKQALNDIKIDVAVKLMEKSINAAAIESQRIGMNALKKKTAILIMQKACKSCEKYSYPNLQKHFYEKLRAINKSKRKKESIQTLSNLIKNIKKDYFDDFVNNQKEREQKQRQYKCLAELCLKLDVFVLRQSFKKIKDFKKGNNNNTLNVQPTNQQDSNNTNNNTKPVNQQPNTKEKSSQQNSNSNSGSQNTKPNEQNKNSPNSSKNNDPKEPNSQTQNIQSNPQQPSTQAQNTQSNPQQPNSQTQSAQNNPHQLSNQSAQNNSQQVSTQAQNTQSNPQQPSSQTQNAQNNPQQPSQTQPKTNETSNPKINPQQNVQNQTNKLNQNPSPQNTQIQNNIATSSQQKAPNQPQNNTLNINPQQNPPNQSQEPDSLATNSTNQPVIQINSPIETRNKDPTDPVGNQTGSNPPNQVSNKNPKEIKPIKEEINENSGEYTSRSNGPSVVGFQKSETSRPITKQELYSLKDRPKFSFQIWQKQAKGFNRKKPTQVEKQQISKLLFNKPDSVRAANKQPQQELNVDILIKQKVVVNPFFPYLMDHIAANSEDEMQKIMSHQSELLKQPLLKKYPLKDYAKAPSNTFNNLLKIGKDKNTTRSVVSMINDILKPVRQSYAKSQKVATVFDGEPSLVTDYSWSHNIVKDEMFLQFIKQIMMNEKQQSLKQLINALQIITRYYYPSLQFMYAFLHYLKSLQSKNIQKLNDCFTNTLLYAQSFERYKGNSVTVLKDEVPPKEKESYNKLLMRATEITDQEMNGLCNLTLRLFNEQKFEYRVRNQSLSLFKRKVLKAINLLHYEDYFGIYYCKKKGSSMTLIPDTIKAIDFVVKNNQNQTDNLLYVKINRYFPFNLKEINKTKMFYLNSLVEQRYLPWKQESYEGIVALSMLFDEFEEYRITNFVMLTGQQSEKNVNISQIEAKYNELSQQKGKKVNEYEYLKLVKENNFLAAKCYRIKEQLLSPIGVVSKVLTKPLELCFYQDKDLKSSVSLRRIKAYYFDKNEITLQIEMSDNQNQSMMRQLSLRGVEKAYEFYLDLSSYIEYLVDS